MQAPALGLWGVGGQLGNQGAGFVDITFAGDQVGSLHLDLRELLGVVNFVKPRFGLGIVFGFEFDLGKHQISLRKAANFFFVFF